MSGAAPNPVPSTQYPVPGTSPTHLLTAEEFHTLGDNRPSELVRGIVVPGAFPGFQHGEICGRLARWVGAFVRENRLGYALYTGVITRRNPDTVRGPALSFFSYQRVPKGESPIGYAGASPEIVFEVVSPANTRGEIATKIGEYLNANVNVVCVVDPEYQTVNLHTAALPVEKLIGDQPLTFADLPGFTLPVRKLFE
jgi:Uma2 family endonuclease